MTISRLIHTRIPGLPGIVKSDIFFEIRSNSFSNSNLPGIVFVRCLEFLYSVLHDPVFKEHFNTQAEREMFSTKFTLFLAILTHEVICY
jgi:hypothetical protein